MLLDSGLSRTTPMINSLSSESLRITIDFSCDHPNETNWYFTLIEIYLGVKKHPHQPLPLKNEHSRVKWHSIKTTRLEKNRVFYLQNRFCKERSSGVIYPHSRPGAHNLLQIIKTFPLNVRARVFNPGTETFPALSSDTLKSISCLFTKGERDKTSVLSHSVITLVALCNKLKMDGRRTRKPNNKYHHR